MGNKLHPGLVKYPVQSVGKAVSTNHDASNREGILRDNPNADSTAIHSGSVTQRFNHATPQIPQPPQGGVQNQYTQNYGSQINGNYIQNQQGAYRSSQNSQKNQPAPGGEAKQGLSQGWF
jgi:hypothetical protein